jgi:hypothetical protein
MKPVTNKVRWSRRRRGCLVTLAGGLALLLALGIYSYIVYQQVQPRLMSGQARLENAVATLQTDPPTALTLEMLAAARADLAGAGADFRAVQTTAGPFLALAPAVDWVPGKGGDISQAPGLLALAIHVSDLGTALVDAVAPVVAQLHADAPAAGGEGGLNGVLGSLVDALQSAPEAQQRARMALAAVQTDRAGINPARLSSNRLRAALDQLDARLPQLARALRSLDGLPPAVSLLLGRAQPATFLVLAQNQDELRATGGFISAVGVLTVDQGRFGQVQFEDSYAVDNPNRTPLAPPADLTRYMQTSQWYIRDANWAPDFPRSARTAETFYQLDKGVAVDGTLALDQRMVQLLVQALGPLTLAGYPEPVRADNVEGLLRHYFMPVPGDLSYEWWSHRKDFMRDLFHALVESLHGASRAQLLAVAVALEQGLEQKHLLLSVHDPTVAAWLGDLQWDGGLRPTPGDSLAVVDTNMGFNKVNPNIEERLSYTVTLSANPAQPHQATLAVTYQNRSPPDGQPCVQEARYKDSYAALTAGCYWDYVRVYVPPGSLLVGARWGDTTPEVRAGSEYSLTTFTTFLMVAPGERRTLTLDYTIPFTTSSTGSYDLTLRKQPGTDALAVNVAIRLPGSVTPRISLPPGATISAGWIHYNDFHLDQDRTFHLGW